MRQNDLDGKKPVRITVLMAAALLAFALGGCAQQGTQTGSANGSAAVAQQETARVSGTVTGDLKFDCAETSFAKDELAAAGIELGDSVDVEFSNGYTMDDVAYLSGYYIKKGSPIVAAYPGADCLVITKNNSDFWTPAGLADGDIVTISLHAKGEYLELETALSQSYSTDADDYSNAQAFANFRALVGGNLKKDFLYRGASPVDNSYNRASTVDALMEQAGIEFELDLADSEEDLAGYEQTAGFSSPYVTNLIESGRATLLGLGSNYDTETFKTGLGSGLRAMMTCGGKAYVHCTEGKDRTGFVCLLLEALAGASVDEMCADYMQTYDNYYGINAADTPETYELVVANYFETFLEDLSGTSGEALQMADYVAAAKTYLAECGLSDTEIEQLQAFICA